MFADFLPIAETVLFNELKQEKLFFKSPQLLAVKQRKAKSRFDVIVVVFLVLANLGCHGKALKYKIKMKSDNRLKLL